MEFAKVCSPLNVSIFYIRPLIRQNATLIRQNATLTTVTVTLH
jgi:hypothetical protein